MNLQKNIYKIYIIWVFVDKTGGILARRINKYAEDKFKYRHFRESQSK